MALQVHSFEESLADNTAYKLEELEMVWIQGGARIGMERNSVAGWLEESITGVKHFLRQFNEEISRHTTSINSSLALESNRHWSLHILD